MRLAPIALALLLPALAQARQPERAPAPPTDIATALATRSLPEVLGRSGPTPLCNAMGEACAVARAMFRQGWVAGSAERKGDLWVASACKKHECTFTETGVAVDPGGRVWTVIVRNGRPTFYGAPPAPVRRVLAGN